MILLKTKFIAICAILANTSLASDLKDRINSNEKIIKKYEAFLDENKEIKKNIDDQLVELRKKLNTALPKSEEARQIERDIEILSEEHIDSTVLDWIVMARREQSLEDLGKLRHQLLEKESKKTVKKSQRKRKLLDRDE